MPVSLLRPTPIGLGTMNLEGDQASSIVERALDLGYRHLDTAEKYGNEEAVGRGLARSAVDREDVFVTTKLVGASLEPARLRAATEAGLRRLGTGHVDLLLIHWPHPDVEVEATLDAMSAVRDAGLTRQIGVSNFPPALFQRAVEAAEIHAHQAECHPYLQQAPLRSLAATHGVTFVAYAPLARGRVAGDPVLTAIGDRHGRTGTQVALRWLTRNDGISAIPRTSSPDHLADNLDVAFSLSDDDLAEIQALDRGDRIVNPTFAPDW